MFAIEFLIYRKRQIVSTVFLIVWIGSIFTTDDVEICEVTSVSFRHDFEIIFEEFLEKSLDFSYGTLNMILFAVLLFALLISLCICLWDILRQEPESTESTVPPTQVTPKVVVEDPKMKERSTSMPIESSCVSLTGDIVGEKPSLEDPVAPPAPPKAEKRLGAPRGRTETPDQKRVREHGEKRRKEHREDADQGNFPNKGPIYIPREPEFPPAVALPDNIILKNVEFERKYNEMYVIGSDVDDIELEPSTLAESSRASSRVDSRAEKKKKTTTKSETNTKSEKSKNQEKGGNKKKSNEPPKKSSETMPEKKPSKETLPEKKTSKENENATPEKKKTSQESVPEKKDAS
ncbi:Protein CBG23595 [Caenorhabditis briggsae]|uniref:Protein CBG23595 n=2 Tax=Caenorhabditis briggsae TaxID=6238 RepID=A8WIW6_CAEBR|nr:Protein CBG23595 [Caenorhabditis briggsae]CAP20410.2 Protein CBG23595 [Caenorhabditis briggsae]